MTESVFLLCSLVLAHHYDYYFCVHSQYMWSDGKKTLFALICFEGS